MRKSAPKTVKVLTMCVDASAFACAIHFNMDAEDLSSLMMSYAKASKLTYDNNLTTLGYADEADPISVKIFPRDRRVQA